MAKLAILFLAAVAFQAAFAGVSRFSTTWDVDTFESRDMMMVHVDMFFKEFCHHVEYKVMDKEMMICCIENFVRFMDFLCEKLECTTCTDKVYMECMMVCKNYKMMFEKMLMHHDFVEMKMEFVRCIRMFYMEFAKWCVHTDICHRLMHKDVFMHLRMMMDKCVRMEFTHMMTAGFHHSHMDVFMRFKMMCKRFITFCETTDMTKEMLMECMHKFVMIFDYTFEKLCVNGKCDSALCMELKNLKMMLDRVMLGDFHTMKMECCECLKIFCDFMEKWMMCDNCCVGSEMIFHDICMRFLNFFEMFCGDMTYHHEHFPMHVRTFMHRFVEICESGKMTEEMIRKFMMIIDYTLEKMCFGGKCDREICVQLKNCKMMLERCLGYGMFFDVHRMRMECVECVKMFFRCCEMMLTCEDCCVGFDMIWRDICMRFESMFHGMNFHTMKDFTFMNRHMYMNMPYFMHRYMKY